MTKTTKIFNFSLVKTNNIQKLQKKICFFKVGKLENNILFICILIFPKIFPKINTKLK